MIISDLLDLRVGPSLLVIDCAFSKQFAPKSSASPGLRYALIIVYEAIQYRV